MGFMVAFWRKGLWLRVALVHIMLCQELANSVSLADVNCTLPRYALCAILDR